MSKRSDVKEVLSIPAGKSYPCIKANLIHSCPPGYSYKPAIYITFRQRGGEMDTLYKVEDMFTIRPHDKQAIERLNLNYKERVQYYINHRNREWPFADQGPRRFYVLSETEQIELRHKPQLLRNARGHCYFTLGELTNGNKIVEVSSKRR